MVGVAAEKRTAIARGILAEPAGEGGNPSLIGSCGQRERKQKADRLGALGGEIGQVHAQRLAADACRRIVGKEMHAGDDAVGGEDEIASGRRRHDRGVVDKTEGARRRSERAEIARDQAVLGRIHCVRPTRHTHRLC